MEEQIEMFIVNDITSFIDSFIAMMFNGVVDSFNILDSLTFHGISLLDFMLGILLLGFIIPIIINLVQPSVSGAERGYKARVRAAERKNRKKGG